LIRILGNLMKRRDKFDSVLIETTGLADPGPVAQTFFADDEVRAATKLDGIVTVVDARHAAQQLGRSKEVTEQIAFADVVLLNKVDLAPPEEIDRLEERIREMNVPAKVYRTTRGVVGMDKILNVGGFDLDRVLEFDPDFLKAAEADHHHHDHHDHVHDEEVSSVGIVAVGDLDAKRFNTWLAELLQTKGPDIYR